METLEVSSLYSLYIQVAYCDEGWIQDRSEQTEVQDPNVASVN